MAKVIALNGSARKRGTTVAMLDAFLEGLAEADPSVEVERVDLFDLDYKGCRGCMGCKLKRRKANGCVQRDGATDLLARLREADGVVFASPIYFWELTAQLRALLERFMYPGELGHHLTVQAIYAMNQPEEVFEREIKPHTDTVEKFFGWFSHDVDFQMVSAHQTQQWADGKAGMYDLDPAYVEERERVHAIRWEADLERSRQAGRAFPACLTTNQEV